MGTTAKKAEHTATNGPTRQWALDIADLPPSDVPAFVDEIAKVFAGTDDLPWLRALIHLTHEHPCQISFAHAFAIIERLGRKLDAETLPVSGSAIVGKAKAEELDRECGREVMVDFWPVWLSAVFAQWKHFWREVGFLAVKEKGDLRTAYLVDDKEELTISVLRTEFGRKLMLDKSWARNHMRSYLCIQDLMLGAKSRRDHRRISDRIRKVLASPPRDSSPSITSVDMKEFLVRHWATALPVKTGFLPPLAYFSDDGLADWRIYSGGTSEDAVTPSGARKTWERLGLRRSQFTVITSVAMPSGFVEKSRDVLILRDDHSRTPWPVPLMCVTKGGKRTLVIPSVPLPPISLTRK